MSVDISAILASSADVYQVTTTLTTESSIADPVAYVAQATVYAEILSSAGLASTLTYVSASLVSSSLIAGTRTYTLTVIFDNSPTTATGHSHNYNTITFPLRESYRDGPEIDLDSTLGPVIISSTTNTIDFFRIRKSTTDYFYIQQTGVSRFGGHMEFYADATHDIGTPDGGVTSRRPRDLLLSRNLTAGGNAAVTGYGTFGSYVLDTHHRFTAQATNPSNDAAVRHLYWNSGDNTLRLWDGAVETIIGGVGVNPNLGTFTCLASVAVGEAVVISAADTVAEGIATNPDRVVGICVNKPNATTAQVQFSGEVSVMAGLTPNNNYYLSPTVAGALTNNPGAFGAGTHRQFVGVAKNATTLVLRTEIPTTI